MGTQTKTTTKKKPAVKKVKATTTKAKPATRRRDKIPGTRKAMPETVEQASKVLGEMPKGEARKLRKLFRQKGHNNLAAAERAAC